MCGLLFWKFALDVVTWLNLLGAVCVCVSVKICVFVFLPAEFPMPKTELVQKFHVHYLGMTSVSRPIGKLKHPLEDLV